MRRQRNLYPILKPHTQTPLLPILQPNPPLIIRQPLLLKMQLNNLIIIKLAIKKQFTKSLLKRIPRRQFLQQFDNQFFRKFAEFLKEFDEFGDEDALDYWQVFRDVAVFQEDAGGDLEGSGD